jgi:hypothetical protein
MADDKIQTARQRRYKAMKEATPEGMPVPATRLRFPIIPKEIEYLDILKNKTTVKSYKSEIAGLSWRKVNEKLFEDGVPAGKYAYGMKFFKNADIYRGFIKSVNANGTRVPEGENENIRTIKQTIEGLKDSLRTNTSSLGIDYIIQATQRAHEAEISIYKIEIVNLKEKIVELKTEISSMDLELDKAEAIIAESNAGNSNNKITETVLGLLNQLTGGNKAPIDLKRKD